VPIPIRIPTARARCCKRAEEDTGTEIKADADVDAVRVSNKNTLNRDRKHANLHVEELVMVL
jgi:hypothetical protein